MHDKWECTKIVKLEHADTKFCLDIDKDDFCYLRKFRGTTTQFWRVLKTHQAPGLILFENYKTKQVLVRDVFQGVSKVKVIKDIKEANLGFVYWRYENDNVLSNNKKIGLSTDEFGSLIVDRSEFDFEQIF